MVFRNPDVFRTTDTTPYSRPATSRQAILASASGDAADVSPREK